MTNEELKEYNRHRQIFQIGVVVADLEEAIKAWETAFRAGPWKITTLDSSTLKNIKVSKGAANESGFSFRVALAMIGGMQIRAH